MFNKVVINSHFCCEALSFFLFLYCAFGGAYVQCFEPIDVVIPMAAKDAKSVDHCIEGIRKHCAEVRYIFIVSEKQYTKKGEWFDEQFFPFCKEEIAACLCDSSPVPNSRVGWYYQQLLKLYAPFVIPGISSNVLVLDADTVFLQPVSFINARGKALYNPGTEFHLPYFQHAQKLLPKFYKVFPEYSGICHHMLLQKGYLERLFKEVEEHAQLPLWKAFCLHVDRQHVRASGASEYELYFNYIFSSGFPVELRFLKWANRAAIKSEEVAKKLFKQARQEGLHYISCHEYENE